MNINWFPGHMKKTYDQLLKNLANFDFVIQVLDARAIKASMNYELMQVFQNKPVINVVMKQDLTDQKKFASDQLVFFSAAQIKKQISNQLNQWFNIKETYYKPLRTGIIVGLPNIGKTTLINKLVNKKNLLVLDKPGTTKKITLQKISDQFYLYDSPGVMLKKIQSEQDGYILCLLGCINPQILNLYDLMFFGTEFLKKHYYGLYFKLTDNQNFNYDNLLNYLGNKWSFYLNNREVNTTLVLEKLYNLFHSGKIGQISYDDKDLTSLFAVQK